MLGDQTSSTCNVCLILRDLPQTSCIVGVWKGEGCGKLGMCRHFQEDVPLAVASHYIYIYREFI